MSVISPKFPGFPEILVGFPVFLVYSTLILGIFQLGFLENLGIWGKLPEFCNSTEQFTVETSTFSLLLSPQKVVLNKLS
jgi:hypothetical protein